MSYVIITLLVILGIISVALCYACYVASRRCSREEEKLERYENDDSGNV